MGVCPSCESTDIHSTSKKFDAGNAVVGGALFGPLGVFAGSITKKDITLTCLSCGYTWTIKPHKKNLKSNKTSAGELILYSIGLLVILAYFFLEWVLIVGGLALLIGLISWAYKSEKSSEKDDK